MTEARWRKSSRSGSATKCVEVAFVGGGVRVRDSKERAGAVLAMGLPRVWLTRGCGGF